MKCQHSTDTIKYVKCQHPTYTIKYMKHSLCTCSCALFPSISREIQVFPIVLGNTSIISISRLFLNSVLIKCLVIQIGGVSQVIFKIGIICQP